MIVNISDEIRKEIAENSENDHIRCTDVLHRKYHYDDDITFKFVVIHLERADVIKKHL